MADDVFFPWTEEYEIGVKLIDNDHRELFDVVNDLYAAIQNTLTPELLREITDRLARYANEHFEREEHLMAEYRYPKLAEHRRKHYEFIRVVYAVRKIEVECPERLDPRRLLGYLEVWLNRHILEDDKAYIPAIRGGYGRRQSDITTPLKGEEKDGEEEAEEMVTVPVQVPLSMVPAIRRCALLMREDEEATQALLDIADPISSMTLDEALQAAHIVLFPDEKH